jgi:hypothetical protein
MERLIRYTAPTKYDLAPYGTVCTVKGDQYKSEPDQVFIQVGEGETSTWVSYGEFLEVVFKNKSSDNVFINDNLSKYKLLK